MPLSLLFILWVMSTVYVSKGKALRYLLVCIFIANIFCNDIIAGRILSSIETPPLLAQDVPHHTYAVVLGGVTKKSPAEDGRVAYGGGADRVLQALRLYKMGKVDTIIVSGGSGKLEPDGHVEAFAMKSTLIQCGVPENRIITESNSKNTFQNAVFSAPHIRSKKALLITSAFHMKRSVACFEKQGIQVMAYPVHYQTKADIEWKDLYFPSTQALQKWELIFHETIGRLSYKIMGYTS